MEVSFLNERNENLSRAHRDIFRNRGFATPRPGTGDHVHKSRKMHSRATEAATGGRHRRPVSSMVSCWGSVGRRLQRCRCRPR